MKMEKKRNNWDKSTLVTKTTEALNELVKLASILCNNSYVPTRNAAKAVDFMQKILPPIQIGAASDTCLGANRMKGGGTAGAEVSDIGFENNTRRRGWLGGLRRMWPSQRS